MLSKIALGTVQFGLDYGITNNIGKVSQDEVRAILKYAKENGIDTLDTASGYGNSEEILGISICVLLYLLIRSYCNIN